MSVRREQPGRSRGQWSVRSLSLRNLLVMGPAPHEVCPARPSETLHLVPGLTVWPVYFSSWGGGTYSRVDIHSLGRDPLSCRIKFFQRRTRCSVVVDSLGEGANVLSESLIQWSPRGLLSGERASGSYKETQAHGRRSRESDSRGSPAEGGDVTFTRRNNGRKRSLT